MIKNLLLRVLGKRSLYYEEVETVLCDVEAVVNSRPLTYISEDPEDFSPLAPANFLIDLSKWKRMVFKEDIGTVKELEKILGKDFGKNIWLS